MKIDVAFLPDHLEVMRGRGALVIDVLRATSTVIALFEAGARDVILAGDLDEARGLKARHHALLVGEVVGRTVVAPGCDLSPSPVEIASRDLTGQRVVLSTTNGSVVLRRVHEVVARDVRVACLANLGAAARVAVARATREGHDLVVVCAARRESRRFALDDAYCAGRLVERLASEAETLGTAVELEDGAASACRIAAGFATPVAALAASATGGMLARDGLAADVEWCARVDWSLRVPVVSPCGDELRLVVPDDATL